MKVDRAVKVIPSAFPPSPGAGQVRDGARTTRLRPSLFA